MQRTTEPGYVNRNGQTVLYNTGQAGSDHGQTIYVLKCGSCGKEYGANGSDIWDRRCPCQGGRPGLPFTAQAPRVPPARVDLNSLSHRDLLSLHAQLGDELRKRALTRSSNNPTGDLAEYLFCEAFGWKRAGKSEANIDAVATDGTRYQIKGRRLTRFSRSRQLSAIRDLTNAHFNYLAGVLFAEDYKVLRAAIIPHAVVLEYASFVERTNSHRFLLRDDIWNAPGVRDVTTEVQAVTL